MVTAAQILVIRLKGRGCQVGEVSLEEEEDKDSGSDGDDAGVLKADCCSGDAISPILPGEAEMCGCADGPIDR